MIRWCSMNWIASTGYFQFSKWICVENDVKGRNLRESLVIFA